MGRLKKRIAYALIRYEIIGVGGRERVQKATTSHIFQKSIAPLVVKTIEERIGIGSRMFGSS